MLFVALTQSRVHPSSPPRVGPTPPPRVDPRSTVSSLLRDCPDGPPPTTAPQSLDVAGGVYTGRPKAVDRRWTLHLGSEKWLTKSPVELKV